MGQIYSGTDFELTIETGVPLAAHPTRHILYRKPGSDVDNTLASTSIVNVTRLRTNVTRIINASSVPAGRWMFHVRIVDGAGKEYLGELSTLLIKHKWE